MSRAALGYAMPVRTLTRCLAAPPLRAALVTVCAFAALLAFVFVADGADIDDAAKEIVYRNYVDISVAVSSPNGLVVPVLRNVEDMGESMSRFSNGTRSSHTSW